jgi:4-aminobutyrate aminotransferase
MAGIEKLRFFPLAVVGGHGSWLLEEGGRELLDLSASWTAAGLGYGHQRVVDAVTRAIANQPGAGGISSVSAPAVSLAERLLSITPIADSDARVYLGNCGSDANDVVLRACRTATGRTRLLAYSGGYHGGFGIAMGVSGVYVEGGVAAEPDSQLLPYPSSDDEVPASLAALDSALARGDVAALIIEPIQSDGGIIVPPTGFLASVVARCRAASVPMICDEVKVGLGRTGWLHAFLHDDVRPDIVTFGKSLGGGLPLSAAVGPASILDGPAASALLTTAGNPVCAASGLAALSTIEEEGLVQRAQFVGERIRHGLLQSAPAGMGTLRGRGLTIGVPIVDPDGQPSPEMARKVCFRAWQLGAVVFYVGGSVLEVTPPLVITDSEADHGIELLVRAIDEASSVADAEVAPFAGW